MYDPSPFARPAQPSPGRRTDPTTPLDKEFPLSSTNQREEERRNHKPKNNSNSDNNDDDKNPPPNHFPPSFPTLARRFSSKVASTVRMAPTPEIVSPANVVPPKTMRRGTPRLYHCRHFSARYCVVKSAAKSNEASPYESRCAYSLLYCVLFSSPGGSGPNPEPSAKTQKLNGEANKRGRNQRQGASALLFSVVDDTAAMKANHSTKHNEDRIR